MDILPWFSLPSNFHLDFRGLGGGDNPDGFADDEYEDSCFDGIDNDGDLTLDMDDDDCDYSQGTRELSRYFYTYTNLMQVYQNRRIHSR